jgi:Short chain fatty acid transporter
VVPPPNRPNHAGCSSWAVPESLSGVISAFGWESATSLRGITKAFIESPSPLIHPKDVALACNVEDGCFSWPLPDTEVGMRVQLDERESLAERFTRVAEQLVPDAFVFALLATCFVVLAACAHGSSIGVVADQWGSGVWDLLPFMTQMSLVVIAGHVLATATPVARLIERLAAVPKTAKTAVAYVAFFSKGQSRSYYSCARVHGRHGYDRHGSALALVPPRSGSALPPALRPLSVFAESRRGLPKKASKIPCTPHPQVRPFKSKWRSNLLRSSAEAIRTTI